MAPITAAAAAFRWNDPPTSLDEAALRLHLLERRCDALEEQLFALSGDRERLWTRIAKRLKLS